MENEEPLKKKRRKKKKRKKDMGNLFFNITQLAILCIFLGVCFIIFQTGYIQKIFQLHQEAQQIMETSTAADFQTDQQGEVYDKDGNLIALLKNDRNLIYLTSDEIPDTVKEAFVSIEDKRFYKHHGFDPLAIIRAAKSIISSESITQGGSTITQQLARNIYLTHTVRWERKVEEIFIAMALEKNIPKRNCWNSISTIFIFPTAIMEFRRQVRGILTKMLRT